MPNARFESTARLCVGTLILAATFICAPVNAQVTRKDVLIMKNGDRLSGNLKHLHNGVLYIETDYVSDSIGVDWRQVESIQSSGTYQVVLVTGRRVMGTIEELSQPDAQGKNFIIREPTGEVRLSAEEVAGIDQQKPTFVRQLTGSVNAGYSFTSGNSESSASVEADATYTSRNWTTTGSVSESFNGQSGASRTNRSDAQFATERFLSRDSFVAGLSDFLHSSQQDLDLRITLGGGYGRYLIRKGDKGLSWVTGAVYTNERFNAVSAQSSDNNVEALVGLNYSSYRFKLGQLQSQIFVFPGLSDFGRIRMTTNNSLTIALTNKFHFTVSFWDNFDSKPPSTAKKNELGISSGIGWKF
jgi:putative salt-induced outer membrane protein YdiY